MTSDQQSYQGERADTRVRAVDVGLLILRVGLGVIFMAHGAQKVFGWFGGPGLDATITGFKAIGIPPALGYLAAFTEFFGGLAVLVGLLARLAGLGLAVVMIVAIALVHLKNGFFLGGPAPGYEFNVALLAMALAIAVAGPGRIAIGDPELRFLRRPRP